jgi:hypothetical protein
LIDNDTISFWGEYVGSELYVDPIFANPDSVHNATIDDVVFKLSSSTNSNIFTISYRSFDAGTGEVSIVDPNIAYVLLSEKGYGISLFSRNTSSLGDDECNYTLTITIKFRSGKDVTMTKNIIVLDDGQVIFSSTSNFALYNVIGPAYAAAIGASQNTVESFYKTELKALTELTFDGYRGDYLTIGNESIFKYLTNVQTLTLSNSVVPSDMFSFNYMPALKTINITNNSEIDMLYLPASVENITVASDIRIADNAGHKIKRATIIGSDIEHAAKMFVDCMANAYS